MIEALGALSVLGACAAAGYVLDRWWWWCTMYTMSSRGDLR